jgi:hypothetical protein
MLLNSIFCAFCACKQGSCETNKLTRLVTDWVCWLHWAQSLQLEASSGPADHCP